jgi:hypothetical protein
MTSARFHGVYDIQLRPFQTFQGKEWSSLLARHTTTVDRSLSYQFSLHAHPYVRELVDRFIEGSIAGLQGADTDYVRNADGSFQPLRDEKGNIRTRTDGMPIPRPALYDELFSTTSYAPANNVTQPYPVKDLDFSPGGAYSGYNWELFYHIPITIGIHHARNHRFDEAERWFHYIFDPTDDSNGPTPERFWKVKPFQSNDVKVIEEILVNLSTAADPALLRDTVNCIEAWKLNPFRPFVIARYRQSAFMLKTVMAYLDMQIAWGDSLFQTPTRENITEATQHYVLAANILGPKPQPIPAKGSIRPQTYASLRKDLDQFGDALVGIESTRTRSTSLGSAI